MPKVAFGGLYLRFPDVLLEILERPMMKGYPLREFQLLVGDVVVPNTEVEVTGGTPGTQPLQGACEDGSVQCHDRQESHWCNLKLVGGKNHWKHMKMKIFGELPKKFANLKS